MAHRRAGRTFHKKTLRQREAREAKRVAEEAAAHPVTVRKMTLEELARVQEGRQHG